MTTPLVASSLSRSFGDETAVDGVDIEVRAGEIHALVGLNGAGKTTLMLPFAVPGLMAVTGAEGVPDLNAIQLTLAPALGAAGIVATVRWWKKAEVV